MGTLAILIHSLLCISLCGQSQVQCFFLLQVDHQRSVFSRVDVTVVALMGAAVGVLGCRAARVLRLMTIQVLVGVMGHPMPVLIRMFVGVILTEVLLCVKPRTRDEADLAWLVSGGWLLSWGSVGLISHGREGHV